MEINSPNIGQITPFFNLVTDIFKIFNKKVIKIKYKVEISYLIDFLTMGGGGQGLGEPKKATFKADLFFSTSSKSENLLTN